METPRRLKSSEKISKRTFNWSVNDRAPSEMPLWAGCPHPASDSLRLQILRVRAPRLQFRKLNVYAAR